MKDLPPRVEEILQKAPAAATLAAAPEVEVAQEEVQGASRGISGPGEGGHSGAAAPKKPDAPLDNGRRHGLAGPTESSGAQPCIMLFSFICGRVLQFLALHTENLQGCICTGLYCTNM